MSPGAGGRQRRGRHPVEAIDLTAEDDTPRQVPKRQRASRKAAAVVAAAGAATVFDLTDEPAQGAVPSGSRRSGRRGAAAAAAPQSAAQPSPARGGTPRRSGASKQPPPVAEAEAVEEPADMLFKRHGRSAAAEATGDAGAGPATGAAQRDEKLPAWHSMKGAQRLQCEFKYLSKQIAAGNGGQLHDLEPVGDNMFKWQFKLKGFDNDCEGGRRLNEDLSVLQALHGQDHLLMEITFPRDYPNAPFFLRMVSPRCVWYTGHVTAGGSVCIEVLTQSGTANSWNPSMCVESIMNTVVLNMLHCESVIVKTASGPGGRSGPLRVDLEARYAYNVMHPYSEHEAQAAFSRMLSHHRSNGW